MFIVLTRVCVVQVFPSGPTAVGRLFSNELEFLLDLPNQAITYTGITIVKFEINVYPICNIEGIVGSHRKFPRLRSQSLGPERLHCRRQLEAENLMIQEYFFRKPCTSSAKAESVDMPVLV